MKKKKKTKKTTVMKSAMSGTDLVCAAAFSSAVESVAVAAVAAKVAAVVEPDPLDMIFAAGMEAKRDAKKKRKLEEQEAQVKEAENMARRPSHSRVVDPIFFEEYDLAEKIDPQRAQVHRVRRRAKSGKSPSRGRTQAGYKSPFEAFWWTRRVSRRALGPQ